MKDSGFFQKGTILRNIKNILKFYVKRAIIIETKIITKERGTKLSLQKIFEHGEKLLKFTSLLENSGVENLIIRC